MEEEYNELEEFEIDHDYDNVPAPESKISTVLLWPFRSIRNYVSMITTVLGWRFFTFLIFSQLLGKGMLYTGVTKLLLPLFKSMNNIDAFDLQIYTVLVAIPWSMKPLMGLASDFITIGGYQKRYWLVIGSIIGTTCSGLVFLVQSHPLGTALCFAGIGFQLSLYDLLSEGKYSEIRNNNPQVGSSITNLVQGMISVGALTAMIYVGFLSDHKLFWVMFIINACLSTLLIFPTLLGWLPEHRLMNAKWIQLVSLERIRKERAMIIVIAFSGIGGIAASIIASTLSPIVGLIIALVLLVLSLIGCLYVFPRLISQVAIYQVVTTLAWPSMGGALDYFYTATPECLANGPHFSYAYYIFYAGVVGTSVTLVSTIIYQVGLSRLRFRPVLFITTILVVIGGLGDLVIVKRWNLKMGIPDKVAYIIGEAIFEPLVDTLNWIPVSALISIAVPKGNEASCYAFIAGISNFSRMVSQLSGSIIFKLSGVVTVADPQHGIACNFDPLAYLIVVCHIILPIIVGIPAVWLIPNVKQTDTIEEIEME